MINPLRRQTKNPQKREKKIVYELPHKILAALDKQEYKTATQLSQELNETLEEITQAATFLTRNFNIQEKRGLTGTPSWRKQ